MESNTPAIQKLTSPQAAPAASFWALTLSLSSTSSPIHTVPNTASAPVPRSASAPLPIANPFLDGPLRRNKTFLFVNYEGFRQHLALSDVTLVPDENPPRGISATRPQESYPGCSVSEPA